MVKSHLIREKLCFDGFFEFLIYPMWGKKNKKNLIGCLVKIWGQGKKITFWSN